MLGSNSFLQPNGVQLGAAGYADFILDEAEGSTSRVKHQNQAEKKEAAEKLAEEIKSEAIIDDGTRVFSPPKEDDWTAAGSLIKSAQQSLQFLPFHSLSIVA